MYKVTMKDGRVYRASKVETAMGFVSMECWEGERRLPSSEVSEIYVTGLENKKNSAALLLVIFIVAFVGALIVIG